jgi:hypothetical protein
VRAAEKGLRTFAELLRVVAAHVLLTDAAGEIAQALFKLGAPFGRVEAAAARLAHPQEVGERPRMGEHVAHGLRPFRADQVVGILPLGQ